jgi:hypothetical protein
MRAVWTPSLGPMLRGAVSSEVDILSENHILSGIAAVAYIAHESSRLRLRITSRGAFLILLL